MTRPQTIPGCEVLPPVAPEQMPTIKQSENPETKSGKRTYQKSQTAGRFAELNNFVDFTMCDLPKSCITVWLVLYRDTRDGTARTSQTDIARRAGISDRAVRTAIRRLESLGLAKVVCQGGLNRGASRYRIAPLTKGLTADS